MINKHFPKHVASPHVLLPESWTNWSDDYWPTTQKDRNGLVHRLHWTYPVHYMSPTELGILNHIGDFISSYPDYVDHWVPTNLRDLDKNSDDYLVWRAWFIGKHACHYYNDLGMTDLSEIKPHFLKKVRNARAI